MSSFKYIALKGVLLLLLLGVASGCAGPQLFHEQLILLDKGLAPVQVQQRVEISPLAAVPATAGGRSFLFQMYSLNNGVQIDPYVLAFEDARLLYWGYIDEFRRQPDRVLNDALNQALPALMAASKTQ